MTENELRDRAANLLGVLPLGQTLPAEYATRITQGYNEVYAQLTTEGINAWGTTIPDEVAPHVIALVAFNCADDFQISSDLYARILSKAGVALPQIRKHTTPPYEPLDDPEDF